MADVRLIDANALKEKRQWFDCHECGDECEIDYVKWQDIENAPTIYAVNVVRCRECKNGAPLPEEARDEFSPGVMRCLAGRGDCDKYCTTWEDGFCDEGAKLDAKDMDVPTKDGGAEDGCEDHCTKP